MGSDDAREGNPKAPTYKAAEDAAWYHFLHGNVPGYQIDFMYRPEVPQGLLTRQHFGHLSRLIKYIEPHTNNPYAFAIGNLSRDDVQHEPGHGGVALIFGFRIEGVTDHAGRRDPPFAHGLATIDRHLDSSMLLSVSRSLYDHLFSRSRYENPSTVLYQEYVRVAEKSPEALLTVLKAYVEDFSDLPIPERSSVSLRWLADEAAMPKRVVIVHPNDAPFDVLAKCSSRIAAMLYQSDIKWSAITNGRESDLPNGVSIRLVAKRDASIHKTDELVLPIDEVPEDEAEIAAQLFKAQPAQRLGTPAPLQGWRARLKAQSGSTSGPTSTPSPPMVAEGGEATAPISEAPISGEQDHHVRTEQKADQSDAQRGHIEQPDQQDGGRPAGSIVGSTSPRGRLWLWLGVGLLAAVAVPIAVVIMRQPKTEPGANSDAAPPSSGSTEPSTTVVMSPPRSPIASQGPMPASSSASNAHTPDAPPAAPSTAAPEKRPLKGPKITKNNGSAPSPQPSGAPTVEPQPVRSSSKSGGSAIDKPLEF